MYCSVWLWAKPNFDILFYWCKCQKEKHQGRKNVSWDTSWHTFCSLKSFTKLNGVLKAGFLITLELTVKWLLLGFRYRLQNVNSLAGVSLMLRLLWACLRWDDMAVKPSSNAGTTRTGNLCLWCLFSLLWISVNTILPVFLACIPVYTEHFYQMSSCRICDVIHVQANGEENIWTYIYINGLVN